jgi:8-oxo-dGTP diphosphatase
MDIIIKVGAIIRRGTKILVVRKSVPGRHTFIIPGGRPENNESPEDTLRRELREELQVELSSFEHFGDFEERAEFENALLRMAVFRVEIEGEPRINSEIKELLWVDKNYQDHGVALGSTLARHVIPGLIRSGEM